MCDVGSEYSANTDSLVIVEIYLTSRQSKRVLRLSGARCLGGYHAKRLNYVVQSLLYWFWPLRPLCGWGFGGVLTLVVPSSAAPRDLATTTPFLRKARPFPSPWSGLVNTCLSAAVVGPGFFSLVFGTFYILPAFFLKYALFDTSLVNSTCFVTTSICLSVCPSIYPSIYPSTRLSVCLSIHLSMHLSVSLSVCPSVYPSIHLSVRPSVCLSTNLDIFSSKCIYLHLF